MWLHQKMRWVPTFTLFLFLYPAGWIGSHFIYLFNRNISQTDQRIIGTLITFILFLSILPSWGLVRWKTRTLWVSIGLDFKNKFQALKSFFGGFIFSVLLLVILVMFLFLCGWLDEFNYLKFSEIFNAVFLIVGIVFAEEIIFRGWLMEEMVILYGLRKGTLAQAAIFSISHYRSDIGFFPLILFFTGLFLFGLVLTLRRTIDEGSLFGCVGLHGGLVGMWYLIDSGMLNFSSDVPYFLLGPSKNMVNPIGGIVGIAILLITLFFQRRLFARTGRFLASTVKSSFVD